MSDGQDSPPTDPPSDDVASLRAELAEARQEAARFRTQRNTALKREHALASVVKAHNIGFDIDRADLEGLKIDHGRVTGEFGYEPQAAKGQEAPAPSSESGGTLSLDDVRAWSPKEINARWEEVKPLLEASKE